MTSVGAIRASLRSRRGAGARGARVRDGARALLAPLLLLVASSACDSSDSGGGRTDFNAFVREQIDATADDTDPVSLDGIQFRFDEDPDAFDDLFP